jgi:hypothetical protein
MGWCAASNGLHYSARGSSYWRTFLNTLAHVGMVDGVCCGIAAAFLGLLSLPFGQGIFGGGGGPLDEHWFLMLPRGMLAAGFVVLAWYEARKNVEITWRALARTERVHPSNRRLPICLPAPRSDPRESC